MNSNPCSEIEKPHTHAENMRLYAEDAAKTNKPWENWQYRGPGEAKWRDKSGHPSWSIDFQYRRKPKTVTKWCTVWHHRESGWDALASTPYKYDSKEQALAQGKKNFSVEFWEFLGVNSFTFEERS